MALFFRGGKAGESVASRIQGITVEIGGDTTKLSTALSKVNKEIRDTQSQLKDVNKLLKLDPGNTDLMAQKQKLLTQAISETKEKLDSLKLASQQANEALAKGEISQSQYDALQREIVETEKALEELEKQADKSAVALQKIGATGEKLKSVGSSIEGVGQKLMPVTAAVGGLGAAAVKVAADFDSGMSQVAAVSGATGKELDALREKAREMGAKTKFSASEAAEAMNYMAMAGWKTGDMLDGIEGIMNLAAASGEDLATTSDIVTDALTALGLSAKDSGHFADILAAASSNANTNVSMMGETFKYCAPVAGALGFTAEDTAEAIGLMANAGIKSSQAGTAMRTMLTSLTGEATFVGDAFGELTIQTTNTDGSMRSLGEILADCRVAFSQMSESEQAANAEALVGKNAMSGFLAVMNAAPADIEKLNSAITNCDGTAEKMAETMQDNLAGQLTILKSQLEELAISIGEILMPSIRQIVGWIQRLVNWLNGLDEGTKKIIVTIALVVAAVAPVLIVIGKVVGAIGTIMTVIPQIAGAISGVVGFVSGTVIPAITAVVAAIGWVPIAIAAVIAIIILLWNKCEWFREAVTAVWEAIKSATVTAWNAIGTFLTNLWGGIVQTGKTVFQGLASFFTACWQGIQNMFTTVLTAISVFFSTIWNAIRTTVVTVGTAIQTFLTTAWTAIKTVITTILTAIQTVFTTVWNTIKAVVTAVVSAIQNFITTAWNTIKSVVTAVMNAIHSVVSGAWNNVKAVTSSVLNAVRSAVSTVFNSVVSNIRTAMGNVYSTIVSGFNQAVSFITGLASSAFRWGADLINGIVNGIRSAIGNVVSAVSDVANAIRSRLHFSVPDEGPLTDYESWMPDFMKGLAQGIEKSKGMVKQAVEGVAADMAISPKVSAMETAQMQVSSMDSIRQMVSGIQEMFAGMQDNGNMGTICIPVYIGGTLLDEVVVNAQARQNLRSGGR